MNDTSKPQAHPRNSLGLFDVTCLIVGVIIGSGIYETPSDIAGFLGSPSLILLMWVVGGLLSLVGALCYAELASTYSQKRGEYFYLRHAYGEWAGFLFAWARLAVIHTGNIAIMSHIAATYGTQLFTFPYSQTVYAIGTVFILTVINALGLHAGKLTQNTLVTIQFTALLLISIAALWASPENAKAAPEATLDFGAVFLALIFVQFTFGGWSDTAFVTVEMRNPQRNILRAMLLGLTLVTAVYLIVNFAMLRTLGAGGMAESDAVVAEALNIAIGPAAALIISIAVIVTALGSVNGMILTGGRLFATLGRDHGVFGFMKPAHARAEPVRALIVQGVVAAILVLSGRFEDLVIYTAAAHWTFFMMNGIALFILRYKDPDIERPYRVHGYPFIPLIFIASCAMLLYSALTYAGLYSGVGFGIVLVGLLIYWFDHKFMKKPTEV